MESISLQISRFTGIMVYKSAGFEKSSNCFTVGFFSPLSHFSTFYYFLQFIPRSGYCPSEYVCIYGYFGFHIANIGNSIEIHHRHSSTITGQVHH
ncbi:MAG: hypothetical protein U0264_11650 [Candidatus Kapaibacterium sp.]